MGKKSGPAPPAAPDYKGLAEQQASINKDASQSNLEQSRVNQQTPYGSMTWSRDPATNQWTSTSTLSPENQALLTQLRGQFSGAIGQPLNAPQLQTSIDMNGLPQLNQDYAAASKQAQDANYQLQTQMLDPQYQQEEEQLRSRLANSGINMGSAAYDQAVNDFQRTKQQAYNTAQLSSIGAGNQQAASLNSQADNAYNTLFGSRLSAGGFANTAQNQNFQNQQTARQLPYSEYMSLMQPAIGGAGNGGGVPSYTPENLYGAAQDQYQSVVDQYNYQRAAKEQRAAGNTALLSTAGAVAGSFFPGFGTAAGAAAGGALGRAIYGYGG